MNDDFREIIREITRLEVIGLGRNSFDALLAGLEEIERKALVRLTDPAANTAMQQIIAMRRFIWSEHFDQPVAERKRYFSALQEVGFEHERHAARRSRKKGVVVGCFDETERHRDRD